VANLQVPDIDERLYESLRALATHDRRSISQEVVHILEKYLSLPRTLDRNPTDEFLTLAGSWEDDRTADEIVAELRKHRSAFRRFGENDELFD